MTSDGSPGVFPRPSINGDAHPPIDAFDIGKWSRAHSFAIHRREELGTLLAAVLVLVPSRLVDAFGLEYTDLLGSDSTASEIFGMAVILLLPATLALLVFRTQVAPRGWVTIDPQHAQIELRLGRNGREGAEADQISKFDAVRILGVSNGATGIDSLASGTLRLGLGDRELTIRVPRGHAEELASSMQRAADSIAVSDERQ